MHGTRTVSCAVQNPHPLPTIVGATPLQCSIAVRSSRSVVGHSPPHMRNVNWPARKPPGSVHAPARKPAASNAMASRAQPSKLSSKPISTIPATPHPTATRINTNPLDSTKKLVKGLCAGPVRMVKRAYFATQAGHDIRLEIALAAALAAVQAPFFANGLPFERTGCTSPYQLPRLQTLPSALMPHVPSAGSVRRRGKKTGTQGSCRMRSKSKRSVRLDSSNMHMRLRPYT